MPVKSVPLNGSRIGSKSPKNRIKEAIGEANVTHLKIPAPNWHLAIFKIRNAEGSPLVISRFPHEAMGDMKKKQEAGDQPAKKGRRAPKDFAAACERAKYIAKEGWLGVNALSFRNAMISACRMVEFKMTIAKNAIFVLADGYDKIDKTPLVKITKGEPYRFDHPAPNSGIGHKMDIRARPRWDDWEATVRVRYDADIFKLADIANLLMRAGIGGVGEGRNDSSFSNGMGWGMFEVLGASK